MMLIPILRTRYRQGARTLNYPFGEPPVLPPRFAGKPRISADRCNYCGECEKICPSAAFVRSAGKLQLDLGKCLFCRECERICPTAALKFSRDFQLAETRRENLVVTANEENFTAANPPEKSGDLKNALAEKFFKHSLSLRVVSAGGCNACEADANVLTTSVWDISRFGIKYVASPRHSDGLLVVGTVPPAMISALLDTYNAAPPPKIVIAAGACAISGGIFHEKIYSVAADEDENETQSPKNAGVAAHLPVDLFIPGCPPHPLTLLNGLLRFLGIIDYSPMEPADENN